jgi:hypothetical protein
VLCDSNFVRRFMGSDAAAGAGIALLIAGGGCGGGVFGDVRARSHRPE